MLSLIALCTEVVESGFHPYILYEVRHAWRPYNII